MPLIFTATPTLLNTRVATSVRQIRRDQKSWVLLSRTRDAADSY